MLSACGSLNYRNIGSKSRLVEDLHLDSIDVVEMVMKLNEEFGIELPEGRIGEWNTVEDVRMSVKCQLSKKADG
jgi:acyl carrier protein